jgi:hypothetical protein
VPQARRALRSAQSCLSGNLAAMTPQDRARCEQKWAGVPVGAGGYKAKPLKDPGGEWGRLADEQEFARQIQEHPQYEDECRAKEAEQSGPLLTSRCRN